jgi:holo-[acyl-carrier protein] synthase
MEAPTKVKDLDNAADQALERLQNGSASDLLCGVDLVELERFRHGLSRSGDRFLKRIYTQREINLCGGRAERLAARFAAKEAVAKALGTGVRGIGWTDIEVLSDASGCPRLCLAGRAAELAASIGIRSWGISLSHTDDWAVAFVVARQENARRS